MSTVQFLKNYLIWQEIGNSLDEGRIGSTILAEIKELREEIKVVKAEFWKRKISPREDGYEEYLLCSFCS